MKKKNNEPENKEVEKIGFTLRAFQKSGKEEYIQREKERLSILYSSLNKDLCSMPNNTEIRYESRLYRYLNDTENKRDKIWEQLQALQDK